MKKTILFIGIAGLLLNSCSKDDYPSTIGKDVSLENSGTPNSANPIDNEKYLVKFAGVLSKAVYDRKDVREFLKKESLKQFDKNYDILYYSIKDQSVDGKSFRDILISYSSKEFIEEIEAKVPLLNILVPEIALFDVHPEKLDVEDKEIPVAVSKKTETSLFLNGKEELRLEKGEVPDFNVFVINENSRVIVSDNKTQRLKSGGIRFEFKSPNFDGSKKNKIQPKKKAAETDWSVVGDKAIKAFDYFNKDDGSINQKAFQRDYIYYGITPQNPTGSLNRSVSEYISYIEINPNTYFKISDQKDNNSTNDDPYVKNNETSQKKRGLTESELLDRLWTKGSYDFRFEIISSTNQQPLVVYVPLKPNEIWDFNLDHSYRHSTSFRHSKHTYRIDPYKFTSKKVFLSPDMISLGKWNLAEESLYRYVSIYEDDESIEKTVVSDYDVTHVKSTNFKGDIKNGVGLKVWIIDGKIDQGGSIEVNETNTVKESKTITIVRKEGSDPLGNAKIFFYDPIVEDVFIPQKRCVMHTYNTGHVKFGISIK